ncbi:hypothetical protein Bbelb_331990 [Branchiostoma belcheri]|nr:hypothetical protein Bbelb_331990 [Branchiostoma belcheri]
MSILLTKLSTTTSHPVKEDLPSVNLLIPVLVPTVATLLFLSLVLGLLLLKRRHDQNVETNSDPRDAHFWVVPNVSTPGLLRSGSLPVVSRTRREIPQDTVSRWSLPPVLASIEPTYAEIPDHVAAAQRPLPALPHTYSEIPDHIAAAQRPLPALPHIYSNIPQNAISQLERSASLPTPTRIAGGDGTASRTSLPAALPSHERSGRDITYGDHDDDDGSIHFYAAAADLSLPTLGSNVQTYRQTSTSQSNRRTTGRYIADCVTLRVRGERRQGVWRLNRLYQPGSQGMRTYVNASVSRPTRQDIVAVTHTFPNTYWPWEIPGEGTRNTVERAPLTLPNTYWPWEIPGEGTRNTARRASLPTVTPPNTYWPWEIPGEGTRNTARRASLPTVTPPNTYWPWEIPGEGTRNTARRASLPTVTPPNTYWPWEIPGEGARNTPRRASLPTVTLPNTYWPWEIPGEGTRNTPRRASLPTVTPPNTYWPWEIPGEGTCNTPRRASLPTVTLPNTYWPWEIDPRGGNL